MLKQESSDDKDGGGNYNNWARVCDTCQSAACTVYCRADLAYLCASCDARVHAANRVASSHERVWVCESCESAPAAFFCKADEASLCTTCDADIHSVNPLARRHHRVPILPISACLYGPPTNDPGETQWGMKLRQDEYVTQDGDETFGEEDEDKAASWLLLNPGMNSNNQNNGFLFGREVDEYLDLVEYNSSAENQFTDQYDQQHYNVPHKSYRGDSVVPVQCEVKDLLQQQQQPNFQLGMDYESSKAHYRYNSSISQTVSILSMDVGVVPESTMSDISIAHTRSPKGTIDLFSGPPIQMPPQLTPVDREARVLRYKEKKKTRKFEKTIRYASKKAYAETRPRIKGRFAKRTDLEIEVDQMFSTTLRAETRYGIVPSF